MPRSFRHIVLVPRHGVDLQDGAFVATDREPWLDLDGFDVETIAGQFVEIVYRLSFWDEPVRPVFRFWRDGGFVDRIAAGPILGRGCWIGRVPRGTHRVSVSPTSCAGRFGFDIESFRLRWWPSILFHGWTRNPRSARSAVLTWLIRWFPESDNNLVWAISSTPFARFDDWRRAHAREPDRAGLERPRIDWASAPMIRVVVRLGGSSDALPRTLASLDAQFFASWQALIIGDGTIPAQPRLRCMTMDDAERIAASDPDGTITGVLNAGDMLLPHALALLAERAHRVPDSRLFYGDDILRAPDGSSRLRLYPGWSPRLQAERLYLGAPFFARDLKTWAPADRRSFLATGTLPRALISSLSAAEVTPLRRVLIEADHRPVPPPPPCPPPPSTGTAAIIIPTRDHPDLLRRLIASIEARSLTGRVTLVVVDNGSVEVASTDYLAELKTRANTRIIGDPRPFNFSRICNEAAAVADADVLVFLNDDMEVLSDHWLDRLVALAMKPDVGAVGARLTYPDGRLQHVGVLVGMGESAGHFGAPAPGDDPGWCDRNRAVHEVSAVTGACLAIERRKFEAVGGFDAEQLPIELSDIDLCLKLNARGWQTLVDPAVHLLHEESATRGGATFRRLVVHDNERAVFIERWRHVLRDDPFFHPGLSLYNWNPALG